MVGAASDILTALSVSYMDRMGASDVTRASIIISKISSVWPDVGAQWATEQGLSAQGLPSQIPGMWDGITRLIIAKALPDGGSAQVRAVADQIGSATSAAALSPLARRYLEYIPMTSASRAFAAQVAAADIGGLATGLDNMLAVVGAGGSFSIPSPSAGQSFNPRSVQNFRLPVAQLLAQQQLAAAGRVPDSTTLPDILVTARAPGIGIPTWGWIVGGTVIAAGLGYWAYLKWGSGASA